MHSIAIELTVSTVCCRHHCSSERARGQRVAEMTERKDPFSHAHTGLDCGVPAVPLCDDGDFDTSATQQMSTLPTILTDMIGGSNIRVNRTVRYSSMMLDRRYVVGLNGPLRTLRPSTTRQCIYLIDRYSRSSSPPTIDVLDLVRVIPDFHRITSSTCGCHMLYDDSHGLLDTVLRVSPSDCNLEAQLITSTSTWGHIDSRCYFEVAI